MCGLCNNIIYLRYETIFSKEKILTENVPEYRLFVCKVCNKNIQVYFIIYCWYLTFLFIDFFLTVCFINKSKLHYYVLLLFFKHEYYTLNSQIFLLICINFLCDFEIIFVLVQLKNLRILTFMKTVCLELTFRCT